MSEENTNEVVIDNENETPVQNEPQTEQNPPSNLTEVGEELLPVTRYLDTAARTAASMEAAEIQIQIGQKQDERVALILEFDQKIAQNTADTNALQKRALEKSTRARTGTYEEIVRCKVYNTGIEEILVPVGADPTDPANILARRDLSGSNNGGGDE